MVSTSPYNSLYENLGMHVLFPKDAHSRRNYVFHKALEGKRYSYLGSYERNLLGKFLSPPLPVICIVGDIGSGKTTTINHLLKYYIVKKKFIPTKSEPVASSSTTKSLVKRVLLGHIDFRQSHLDESKENLAINVIVDEMRARITNIIDDREEFVTFWDYLNTQFNNMEDWGVAKVARRLVAQFSDRGMEARKKLFEELTKDLDWYLSYLVLLWRYILDPSNSINKKIQQDFGAEIETGLIILDNLDSLPARIQRHVYDMVLHSAHQRGPAFVIVMRSETFSRLGRADLVFDLVSHEGPKPIEVVKDRLEMFVSNPSIFFSKVRLEEAEKDTILSFVKRTLTKEYYPLEKFLVSSSGNSIRLGSILSQGIFLLSPSQINRQELTPYFVIRSCISQGKPLYSWNPRSPVENILRVSDYEANPETILLKIRILQYLFKSPVVSESETIPSSRWKRSLLSEIRNTLITLDYDSGEIREAINQMIRNECQLLTSNGENVYTDKWQWDHSDSETIFLTKIGEAYISDLLFSVDYLQEIIFDTLAYPGLSMKLGSYAQQQSGQLSEKFDLLHRFLRTVHDVDCAQTKRMLKKLGPSWFIEKFGGRLISSIMIVRITESALRILTTAKERYPRSAPYYDDVMSSYQSLTTLAKNNSEEILGVEY